MHFPLKTHCPEIHSLQYSKGASRPADIYIKNKGPESDVQRYDIRLLSLLPPKRKTITIRIPCSIVRRMENRKFSFCRTHSSMLSTPPTSFQSAQLTRPTARVASSMSALGPHEPMTMPLGETVPWLWLRPRPVVEYASRTPAITVCIVALMSGRPARRCMPGGSAVRGTRGAREDVRVQCTEKRSESVVCGDGRGCMSGTSSGRCE